MDTTSQNAESTDPGVGVEMLGRASAIVAALIASVAPDQWQGPTPCEDMTVHGLVEHAVGGLEQFASVGRGEPVDLEAQQSVPVDAVAEAYRAATDRMLTAWSGPQALDHDYPMPWGDTPGVALVDFMLIEQVAHGWDLARATSQPCCFDADIEEATLRLAHQYDDESIRVPGMFGPEVPAPDDAPTIDRLAAFLGRHPDAM